MLTTLVVLISLINFMSINLSVFLVQEPSKFLMFVNTLLLLFVLTLNKSMAFALSIPMLLLILLVLIINYFDSKSKNV